MSSTSNRHITTKAVVNSKVDENAVTAESETNREDSLVATGFLELYVGDTVSIQISTNGTVNVMAGSSLYFRFHDGIYTLPGFLFSLSAELSGLRNLELQVGPWEQRYQGQFTSASSFRPSLSFLQIPDDGVYLVVGNVIIQSTVDVNLDVMVQLNGETISTFKYSNTANEIITLSFTDLLNLPMTGTIHLEILGDDAFMVLGNTTFSILMMRPESLAANSFRAQLEFNNFSMTDVPNSQYSPIETWKTDGEETHLFREMAQSTLVDDKSFSIEAVDGDGVYYVTANIIAKLETSRAANSIEVVFYKGGEEVFKSRRVKICTATDCQFSMNLVAVLQLSKATPIAVAITGANLTKIEFDQKSSFGALQAIASHPGFHGYLGKESFEAAAKLLMTKWVSKGEGGVYDFTNSFNITSGIYTASRNGIFLVTSSVILSDASKERVSIHISKDSSRQHTEGFYAKESYPSVRTTLNAGGILFLEKGQTMSLYVQADDQDWTVQNGGMDVSFISSKSVYFQATILSDVDFFKIDDQFNRPIKDWRIVSSTEGIKIESDGIVTAPYTGIYYTIASLILDNAAFPSSRSFYKANLRIDHETVSGVYAKRKIGLTQVDNTKKSYTLFFSGSFHAEKGSKIFVEIETGDDVGFVIVQSSNWAVMFMRDNDHLSGGLGTLQSDVSFRDDGEMWKTLNFAFAASGAGGIYELTPKLSFDSGTINIHNDGIFVISANIEVEYNADESIMLELSVFINENRFEKNGLNIQKKSFWKAETLHISGAVFLKNNDKVEIKFSAGSLPDTKILGTSGLSIVMITEEDQTATFTARIKVRKIQKLNIPSIY